MGKYDSSGLDQYLPQQNNPAAPAGAQQMAGAAAGAPRYQGSALSNWLPSGNTYTEGAQQWFTGANKEGTNEGWDNQFVDDFQSGWDQALKEGRARDYFSGADATGVVTWDHEKDGRRFHFGDVYDHGEKTGNIYEMYDRDTANLMMAPWILDADTQADTFAASDRMDRLDREITSQREDRNKNFENALESIKFQNTVEDTATQFREGQVDTAIAGGGAAGGAALGAGIGSFIAPGLGTAIGGGAGAILGGVGAWLNRDSLTEQAARAYEITSMSFEDNGAGAGIATGVAQWSGFGGRLISPVSNLTQGVYDATAGAGGDGRSEFYRLDDRGKSHTPTWVKVADVGASVGDSLLQFASPVGAAAYTAQMSGTIGGEVGELALTGGESFDYRRGNFDNIFVNDKGDFDPLSAAAGIGKVGIDAVQLGMARGLMGKANASMEAAGGQGAYGTLAGILPARLTGRRALEDGQSVVREAGYSFVRAADGSIVEGSRRATLSLLAPSEQVAALSARVTALRQSALSKGAYSTDDFYRAASQLATGERRVQAALVNGFGEGYEEALQSILEPLSHNDAPTAGEIATSFAYGAAMGAGMSAGAGLRSASIDDKMFAQAQTSYQMSTGGAELDRETWNSWTDVEKRQAAALSAMQAQVAQAAYKRVAEDQAMDANAGAAGVHKLLDAQQSARDKNMARLTDRTDGAFVITQLESVPMVNTDGTLPFGHIPVNSVVSSGNQLLANLTQHTRGAKIRLDTIARNIADLEAKIAADPNDADAPIRLAAQNTLRESTQLELDWGYRLLPAVDQYLTRLYDPAATIPMVEADAAELNDFLQRAYDGRVLDFEGTLLTEDDKAALARSVSLLHARDPHDQAGSYQILLPQVSPALTWSKADNVLEISHAILPALRGDYDGDKIRQLNQLILDDAEYLNLRTGSNLLGAGQSVNLGAPKYEAPLIEYMSEALASPNPVLQSFAENTLLDIAGAIQSRYASVIPNDVLDAVLADYFEQVRANNKDAREKLLDGLAGQAGNLITGFSRENRTNEWLWLDQLIVSSMQMFQEAYAEHRPRIDQAPNTEVVPVVHQSPSQRERTASNAATVGQTLGNLAPGDTMFRKFQKIHYTKEGAAVLGADMTPTQLAELVDLYRELGQKVTRSELARVRAQDDIVGRVYVQLQRLADDAQTIDPRMDRNEALVVVANMQVVDIDIAEDGTAQALPHPISLAQLLLKQSVMRDRREKDRIFDASPELQAKHQRLLRMTRPKSTGGRNPYPHGAQETFVEVVGAQQLYTLLGQDAEIFGPHLTVEQWVRQFASLSETDRRTTVRESLRMHPAYLGRKKSIDMPYEAAEVAGGEISAYRSVVDALVAVGNRRHTEIAERSDRVGEAFRGAHAQVKRAIREFTALQPSAEGAASVEGVRRLFEANPDFARQVMDLIPDVAANVGFQERNGSVYAANWLYEMFTIEDSEQAEMHYWRNLLITEWRALGVGMEEGHSKREFNRLPRRMHRILYALNAQNDGGLKFNEFFSRLQSATSLADFMTWVNDTGWVRGDQAPLAAWVDDVAEFDMDKAKGGWTSALEGAVLREAIGTLRTRAENLVSSIVEERAAAKADVRTQAAIRRVMAKDAGKTVTLASGDRDLYDAFVKSIELASERLTSLGPQAMLYEVVGATRGFYPSAHTKGTNPDNVALAGAMDAQRDAYDYVTNYERYRDSMTAVNLPAVGANLAQVAKDGGRTMDEEGRTVEWGKLDPAHMLDLLDNPETKPFARAILFPQVMERTIENRLSPQFLVGKSLSELLRGVSMKDMFPRGAEQRLSGEASARYVSMLEGIARKYNGHYAVQRAVTDIMIARTSAATHMLSDYEIEQLASTTMHEVAQVMQAVGAIAAQPQVGQDLLGDMLENVRAAQRLMRTSRALGLEVKDANELSNDVIDSLIQERENEITLEITELGQKAQADPANEPTYRLQMDAIYADHDAFKARVELLRTDDLAGKVADMFYIDDKAGPIHGAKMDVVADYIRSHLSMMQRASGSLITLNKFISQDRMNGATGTINLEPKEWAELSRAVIGVYLDDAAHTTTGTQSVSPWPNADRESDRRYYDSTWTYLIEALTDSDGPLVQAAVELHEMAGRHGADPMTQDEFYNLLGRTILDGNRLGEWTGDIPRASIEANQRLDSAAAAPAIAMAGNSPKRLATIIAATRRTFRVPTPDMLSTVSLSLLDLKKPLTEEIPYTSGAVTGTWPLAQLNNRFADRVTMRGFDAAGQPVELDLFAEEPTLGYLWHIDASVRDSGFKLISVERLKNAVDRVARKHGLDPMQMLTEVSFVHPDSQPAAPEWSNNIYFEGTSFSLDADVHESLLSTLWFVNGGISPTAQAMALDASKLGVSALQVIDTVPAAERTAIEADWANNFSGMLRSKTMKMMTKDLGFGYLDSTYYNAVYKDMKLRHFVRGTNTDGTPALWSAEQVIEHQRTQPGVPLPLTDAELWIPTDDVLRSLLGEIGNQGVAKVFDDQLEIDPSRVPTYRGVTPKMMQLFAPGMGGEKLNLEQTSIMNRARQTELTVRMKLDEKQRNKFDARMRFFHQLESEIGTDRAAAQRSDLGKGGFDVNRNLAQVVAEGNKMLRAERLELHWMALGIPYGPRKPEDTMLSAMLLKDLNAAVAENSARTGWIYEEGAPSQPVAGRISEVDLNHNQRKAYHLAPKDLLLMRLDSFAGDVELAKKRIDYFTDAGVYVILAASDGQADMRSELAEYLMGNKGYTHVMGSQHAFQPVEHSSKYQNLKMRASNLTEMRGVSRKSRLLTLNVRGLGIQEGAMWVDPDNENLGSIGVVANLIPTSSMGGINIPATTPQIEAVHAQIRSFDTAEGRTFLRDMANSRLQGEARATADVEWDKAFDRLLRRITDHPGKSEPQPGDTFGNGDFLPLVDQVGRVVLYRHGYQALARYELEEQLSRTMPGSKNAANIAVFPSITEPGATTHTGEVVEVKQRAGFGLSIELDVPFQLYGGKFQLEANGLKMLATPKPKRHPLPDHGVFRNRGIDGLTDLDSVLSKEAVGDMIIDHRSAFMFFGIDFMPDVAEFFFPGEGQAAHAKAREVLRIIQTKTDRITFEEADALLNSQRIGALLQERLPTALIEAGGVRGDWDRLNDMSSVENRITAAIMVYLMTPGARITDVIRSGGMNDESTSPDAQSLYMPRLFTQVFDNEPLGSPLRTEINKRLNQQIHNPNTDGTGYVLHQHFEFEVLNPDPKKNLRGFLQFAEAHYSSDNPVKNGMAFDESAKGPVSQHSAAIAASAIGAETAYAHDLSAARRFATAEGVEHFERDKLDGGAWRQLTALPENDRSFTNWNLPTPGEQARREDAREALVQLRHLIDTSDEYGWDDKLRKQYEDKRRQIMRQLNLLDKQAEIVDFWVRQMIGRPQGQDVDNRELGRISGHAAIDVADDILRNVQERYLPTLGAEVPLLHLHDLQMIYRANKNKSTPWRPRESMGADITVQSWDDWVGVSLGSALTSDNLFDPLYLLALDGFMHTYQNATRLLSDLPVSMDANVSKLLLDPDLNAMLVSLDPRTQRLSSDPFVLDATRADLSKLIGGHRVAGKFKGQAAPAAEVAKRREARRAWRKKEGIPIPVDVSMKNFRRNGVELIHSSHNTNSLTRVLINLRVGTALINPALWVSMGPEQWIRGTLDRAANLLTGQATVGLTAKGMAASSARGEARANERRASLEQRIADEQDPKRKEQLQQQLQNTGGQSLMQMVGLTYRYTPDQLRKLNELYAILGQRSDFKGMVYRDLWFKRPMAEGMGRIEKMSEAYAKFGSRAQDPTYGMKANTLARRYLEGALQHMMANPLENVITVDQLIDKLALDPTFLQSAWPEAHAAGTNALAQIRSLKETVLSQALKAVYEPMAASSHAGVNMFGNIVLKIPLLFSGYAMNVATSILGLQGLDQMTAMFLQGRDKPNTFIGRMIAQTQGKEFTPKENSQIDLSSVMEGVDLSRAFIRGGLTHTGLFVLGMMAGGLGLGGEDDEAKKRRLLAEAQGVGNIYDPRAIENDFRNSDALFLDALPFGLGSMFEAEGSDARPMANLHWMMRQFVSPMMGMERFFQTGDFRQVTWGFQDALGSFPLINASAWDDAHQTVQQLLGQAHKGDQVDAYGNVIEKMGFLTSAVGTYERMLFESSWVNQLYVGLDEWDRDPYVLPLRNSTGELNTDIAGNARPQNLALETFLGNDGKLARGYLGRTQASEDLHVLTENRATMATVASLFSGLTGIGDTDYYRYQMPIRTTTIEKPTVSMSRAEEYMMAAFQRESLKHGGVVNITAAEAETMARNMLHDRDGIWYADDVVMPLANQISKQSGTGAGLSLLDSQGNERLTEEGARAVLRGLFKKTANLDDAALEGIAIPYDMRVKIQAEWSKELVQEGIDMGLDEGAATKRMERVLRGPYNDGSVPGLADYIWSDKISYDTTATYGRLNTTYVIGPDGRPWATGFERGKLMSALGLDVLDRQLPFAAGTKGDERGNVMDLTSGMNTGLRALVPLDDTRNVPTDVEIAKEIEDAIKEAGKASYTPFKPYASSSGNGYGGGYGGYGGYSYGGYGGGGGGGGGAYFTKMYALPKQISVYGNSIPFINTSSVILRRAFVRRENINSQRGRLNQWQ